MIRWLPYEKPLSLVNHRDFSSKGGKAGRGAAKARTSEQARRAAFARWARKPYPADKPLLPKADVPPNPLPEQGREAKGET